MMSNRYILEDGVYGTGSGDIDLFANWWRDFTSAYQEYSERNKDRLSNWKQNREERQEKRRERREERQNRREERQARREQRRIEREQAAHDREEEAEDIINQNDDYYDTADYETSMREDIALAEQSGMDADSLNLMKTTCFDEEGNVRDFEDAQSTLIDTVGEDNYDGWEDDMNSRAEKLSDDDFDKIDDMKEDLSPEDIDSAATYIEPDDNSKENDAEDDSKDDDIGETTDPETGEKIKGKVEEGPRGGKYIEKDNKKYYMQQENRAMKSLRDYIVESTDDWKRMAWKVGLAAATAVAGKIALDAYDGGFKFFNRRNERNRLAIIEHLQRDIRKLYSIVERKYGFDETTKIHNAVEEFSNTLSFDEYGNTDKMIMPNYFDKQVRVLQTIFPQEYSHKVRKLAKQCYEAFRAAEYNPNNINYAKIFM